MEENVYPLFMKKNLMCHRVPLREEGLIPSYHYVEEGWGEAALTQQEHREHGCYINAE